MTAAPYILFFLSGAAALGYQLVWAKMFSVGLGHEMPSVLAVTFAFMGGMSVGAGVLSKRISSTAAPAHFYGWLLIVIGVWGLVSGFLIPRANDIALVLIGPTPSAWRHWTIAFLLPFVTLLPATAAMGATFPAIERFLAAHRSSSRVVGISYAINTAGAVAGTLLAAFVLMPALGFSKTAFCFAGVSIVCGLGAMLLPAKTTRQQMTTRRIPVRLGTTVFITGLLGMAYETVGIRVLSTVLENTIYTFAGALAVFLTGLSIGAALYQRRGATLTLSSLLIALAVACLAGMFPMAWAGKIYNGLRGTPGTGSAAIRLSEIAIEILVFLPATVLMGAIFSHLVQSVANTIAAVGRLTALNTFGAALGPALFGIAIFPLLGPRWTLLTIATCYLALVLLWSKLKWSPLLFILIALCTARLDLSLISPPPGEKILEKRTGVMASVAVLEDHRNERTLRINNRFQQGGTAAASAEYRQAHIPLLLHPDPREALFLGLGTGITLGAASLHPNLHAHAVELVPEVVDMLQHFKFENFQVPNPRATVGVADARRFVRTATNHYDVIVAELFHPAMDGAGLLYSVEHFRAIRARLNAGGLFCQWLPLYQLDDSLLRIVARTFFEVFPDSQVWLLRFNIDAPVVGLIGWTKPTRYSGEWIEKRLYDSNLQRYIHQLTLSDSVRFFAHLLLDTPTLRGFCEGAPLNTDDQPRVVFAAPGHGQHEATEPYRTLLRLLPLPGPAASAVLSDSAASAPERLSACWRARDTYLRGLIAEEQGSEREAIDAFVESARLSPDFTLGYARCISLASARAKTDPDFARELLQRLIAAQPEARLGQEMLQRLIPPATR